MSLEKGWKVVLGSFLLLIVTFLIYYVRYPMWNFSFIEPIFAISFLSYLGVFLFAVVLLKKDSKKSLSDVFKNKGSLTILIGLLFALLYLGLWYLISYALGSKIEFGSFGNLRGFENYAVYSLPLALSLYLAFSVFGAFTEEVAYRGYVLTRISSRYGYVIGIMVSALFFSFQHIHIFQVNWLTQFFQSQFLHVILFGIFTGYLYFKSKENIWSVFSFHVLLNIFSVTVPIIVTQNFQLAYYVAEITSFFVMILLLRYLPLKNKNP